jgi:hypothetical protein
MAGSIKTPCQALIVRYAPDPASGEMLNIGVVLLSAQHHFLGARFLSKWARLTQAFPETEKVHLARTASAIERSFERQFTSQLSLEGTPDSITALFDAALPADDASIVHSAPITGVTADPGRTLAELFERYVAARDVVEQRVRRPDEDVWRSVSSRLNVKNVIGRLEPHTVRGRRYELDFPHAWKNGRWNVAQPISLDLVEPYDIRTKAASWSGRIAALQSDEPVAFHLLVGLPSADAPPAVRAAADDGFGILTEQLHECAEVTAEEDAERLAQRIADDILGHEAAEE